MASQGQNGLSKTSAKATNLGGRPRKYATVAEAKAHEIEKQRLERHRHRQSRNSKASPQAIGALQFVPYQPEATKPGPALPTQAVQKDEEQWLGISASKAALGERLHRMETMLHGLARKVDTLQPDQTPIEDSQEREHEASANSETNENAPVLKLLDYVITVGAHISLWKVTNTHRAVIGTPRIIRVVLKIYQ